MAVEFAFVTTGLFVPISLAVTAVLPLVSAQHAADLAARASARAFVLASTDSSARARAIAATAAVAAETGVALRRPSIACSATPCLTSGGTVRIQVTASKYRASASAVQMVHAGG